MMHWKYAESKNKLKAAFNIFAGIFFTLNIIYAPAVLQAQDILLISTNGNEINEIKNIRETAEFAGLDLMEKKWDKTFPAREILKEKITSETKGVIIMASVLESVSKKDIITLLNTDDIRILIAGITPETDPEALKLWSDGRIKSCQLISNNIRPGEGSTVLFAENKALLSHLAEIPVRFSKKETYSLEMGKTDQQIKGLINVKESGSVLMALYENKRMFYSVGLALQQTMKGKAIQKKRDRFIEKSPYLIFMKIACGEFEWKIPGYYANFTIDDPWLTEPYGQFSYYELLREMKKYRFHTTIAFIPWNFNRSSREISDLIRDHPAYYSICYHGNDHGPDEFQNHKNNGEKVKQAIARMERFNQLTGIPVDPVMVFPRGIGNKESLEFLKKYNFICTVNSTNIPSDASDAEIRNFSENEDDLRIVTTYFNGFPSIYRYSLDEIEKGDVAIDLFLGNPVLIYSHHDYVKNKKKLLDLVGFINKSVPEVNWSPMKTVTEKLYVVKHLGGKNQYTVRAFSNRINIINADEKESLFRISMPETFDKMTKSIMVNKSALPDSSMKNGGPVLLSLTIPGKDSALTEVMYVNDLDVGKIDIEKSSFLSTLYRKLSDFRDMTSGRYQVIRSVKDIYNISGLNKYGLKGIILLIFLTAVALFMIVRAILFIRRKYTAVYKTSGR